jgi:hypothetical protein
LTEPVAPVIVSPGSRLPPPPPPPGAPHAENSAAISAVTMTNLTVLK